MKKLLLLLLLIPIISFAESDITSGDCGSDCSSCKTYEERLFKVDEIKNYLKTNIENEVTKPHEDKMNELRNLISRRFSESGESKKDDFYKVLNDPVYDEFLIYSRLSNMEKMPMETERSKEIDNYMRLRVEIQSLSEAIETHFHKKVKDDKFYLPVVSMTSESLAQKLVSCTLNDEQFLKAKLKEVNSR
jgi:hypothetical protein